MNAAGAEIVVRMQTKGIGKVEAVVKLSEMKVEQKSWLRSILGM